MFVYGIKSGLYYNPLNYLIPCLFSKTSKGIVPLVQKIKKDKQIN